MKTAILDLGTNTFNLLVAEHINGSVELIHREKIAVKLGEKGFQKNMLMPEAMDRALSGIAMLLESAKAAGVEKISAFATSAVRNAQNRNEFLSEVKEKFGITIDVISGIEEAKFIYSGVKHSGALDSEKTLIMDIGGGSTEFIIADCDEAYWLKSYDIGAARLKEMFDPENPIKPNTQDKISKYISEEFEELKRKLKEFKVTKIVGSSGSFDSIVDMIAASKRQPYPSEKVTNEIAPEELNEIIEEMKGSTLEQRQNRDGLISMRVDFIVISCMLIETVLSLCPFKEIKQCSYSLKEGVLFNQIKK
ncbi:Ppx/GppA phosphatase family protein [Luteibaculum oceani]|nr:exopolyphosphatase [Luteibaculum oceani]